MPFKTLLSYPVNASVSMHFNNGTVLNLPLNEMTIASYAYSGLIQPYHAYSPSGTAQGKVVFVNYGSEDDYRALGLLGVNVSGCIVIVKKGGSLSRGAAVEIAEQKGALGVLMYAEGDVSRGGFGFGVERGTVMKGVGDPLSPGWAGVEDGERLELEDNKVLERFPGIPSLPLSFESAQLILESLGGPLAPQEWRNSGRSKLSGVGPGQVMVNFTYQVGWLAGRLLMLILFALFVVTAYLCLFYFWICCLLGESGWLWCLMLVLKVGLIGFVLISLLTI